MNNYARRVEVAIAHNSRRPRLTCSPPALYISRLSHTDHVGGPLRSRHLRVLDTAWAKGDTSLT